MRTYNKKESASEKGIQKMGLTRSSSVTWELVYPSKIATEMVWYITQIVKMTGDTFFESFQYAQITIHRTDIYPDSGIPAYRNHGMQVCGSVPLIGCL